MCFRPDAIDATTAWGARFTVVHTGDFWVFVLGPVTGATVAAAYYKVINAMQDKETEDAPAADRADEDVKPLEA